MDPGEAAQRFTMSCSLYQAGRVVEDPKEVANVAAALSMIKGCALSPRDSRQFIADIRG